MFWFKKKEKIKISGVVERFAMKDTYDGTRVFHLILINSEKSEKSVIKIIQ